MSTLLKDASAAEAQVKLISDLVEDRSVTVLTSLILGFASVVSAAGTKEGSIPIHVSQAENTIANNIKIDPFEWTINRCLGCGSKEHNWRDRRSPKIVCPNANRPGAQENLASNLPKLRTHLLSENGTHQSSARGKRCSGAQDDNGTNGSPSVWSNGSNNYKKKLIKDLMDPETMRSFLATCKQEKKRQEAAKKSKGSDNKEEQITLFTSVVPFVVSPANVKPFPVSIDADLPHV